MSDCLVIMNVRNIEPCIEAFDSITHVDKLWLTGYTEKQLADGVFMEALHDAGHDQYLVCADDILLRYWPVELVRAALVRHPVATGYSQRSHTDMTVNVTKGPLDGDHPRPEAYDFATLGEVLSHGAPTMRTWFAGMSITGMSMAMWERFPFGCYCDEGDDKGYASDFHLSKRLQDAGVPIVAVRDAFAYHWRNEWRHTNHPGDAPLFLGRRPSEVRLERALQGVMVA